MNGRLSDMKKTKISGIIGIALILSAVLLIALTAFFGVFDANRKVNEFVDTLPGNKENIETPLPDEPETTLPDTPDTPVTPDVTPSEPPTVAEAAKAISQRLPSTVSNAGTYGFPNNCWTSYNKDSDGNPVIKDDSYDIPSDVREDFNNELKELSDEEIDIDIRMVSAEEFEKCEQADRYDIPTGEDFAVLGFMLKD